MTVTRRGFLRSVAPPAPATVSAMVGARGCEAYLAGAAPGRRSAVGGSDDEVRLNSNENPLGPGAHVIRALERMFPEAGRYPFNATPSDARLVAAIAATHRVTAEQIVLGAGSQEILKNAVRAFTSPAKGVVSAWPSFENCVNTARRLNHPVVDVNVDSAFRLDLDAMAAAARQAGLVFVCNPNNPTGTVHGLEAITRFVHAVRRDSPGTTILIDEAYHEYVTDRSYGTAVRLALETPNVVVSRTFSKVYGMAGLRVGYAVGRRETIARLAPLRMPYNVSVFSTAAALAALERAEHVEQERARNTAVRAFTVKALLALGCQPVDSHANFLFVHVQRPAAEFREACAKRQVIVGRDFPPFEKSHVRISIGTMAEMQKATAVFRSVLSSSGSTSGNAQGGR